SRAVAGEVAAWNFAPVGLLVTGLIAVDRARDRRPGFAYHQQAALTIRDRLALSCNHFRHNSEEGFCGGTRLGRDRARDRRDNDRSRLRLPVGVDDRAALLADH